jgi:MoaA/NifB/PqqE/SkfB family radical SAM enzyme
MLTSGPDYDKKISDLNRILTWLEHFDKNISINLAGSGDALASLIFRNFIKNYQHKPTQQFLISTNGLLLNKVMPGSQLLKSVQSYRISVDAGTKDVYENVRRPGKWEVLLNNLKWLKENRQRAAVTLNFVLQKDNYKDLSAFADLCEYHGFGGEIQPLNDWGTWNHTPVINPDAWTIANGTYLDHNIANVNHPEHQNFIQVLNNFRDKNYKCVKVNPLFDNFI